MNKFLGILIVGIILAVTLLFVIRVSIMDTGTPDKDDNSGNATSTMQITSTAFEHEQSIPQKYTCDDGNVNPPLAFADIPESAQTLVLIVDDPDAPTGTWVHWTLWNIPATTTAIAEDSVSDGAVQGMTSFGQAGYGGPCPPDGEHRYFFKVYALDTELELDAQSDKEVLEEAMVGHVLDKAELIGVYERP